MGNIPHLGLKVSSDTSQVFIKQSTGAGWGDAAGFLVSSIFSGISAAGSVKASQQTQQTQQTQQVQRAPEQTPEQIIQSQRDQVKVM